MDTPNWWNLLNLEDTLFERSRYAAPSFSEKGAFRLKNLDILKKIYPYIYQSVGEEVKEFNEYHLLNGNTFDKVKLGRKLGSIPLLDAGLHPELLKDKKAQDKYWQEHPEFKADKFNKHHPVNEGRDK